MIAQKEEIPLEQKVKNLSLEEIGKKFHIDVVRSVPEDWLDADMVSNLSVEWARSNLMLPIHYGGKIGVLTSDPASISAQKHLALLLGQDLIPVLAPADVITKSIERCYFSKKDTPQEFLADLDEASPTAASAEQRSDDLLQSAENTPITQLVNLILLEALKAGASDVHIEPFKARLRIRYRIDGILYEQACPPKHMEAALISRIKVMAHMDIAEKRLAQDGASRVRIGEREIDIRISTIPVAEGERIVLRLLNRQSALLPISELGMPEAILTRLQKLLQEPNGIIIVCGPTGSGKTTTLYATLQELDKTHSNILTVEDPIEYQLPDIGQIQVKPKIGLTFASGLRHILRQDPDTILIGEIRDLETAEIAIQASLTGHLVFSTLHTNDAPSAVIRMVDMGIQPYLLAASLRAVLAQRLIRKLCPVCRVETRFNDNDPTVPKSIRQTLNNKTIWKAKGCSKCLQGFSGRTGLFELMLIDQNLSETIRTGQTNTDKIRQMAVENGMTTLLNDSISRVLQGQTSLSEVLRTLGKNDSK